MISMRKRKKDNRGFSLITVILADAFIAILGLLVLYLALQNFRMKATNIKGKDSFYTAEQALEEIRMGLQQDVGDAMSTAYIKVMEAYNKDRQSTDAVMDELRQKDFESTFLSELTAHVRAALYYQTASGAGRWKPDTANIDTGTEVQNVTDYRRKSVCPWSDQLEYESEPLPGKNRFENEFG